MCQIECTTQGGCDETNEHNDCVNVLADGVQTTDDIPDEAACTKLCKESKEGNTQCRFWRFEPIGNSKLCTLMKDDQCADYDHCDGHCSCGEVCKEGEDPPKTDKDCKGPIEYKPEMLSIHWGCYKDGEDISPYGDDKMPADTICTTVSRCVDWEHIADEPEVNKGLWRKLQVTCDGADGKWKPNRDAGGEYTDDSDEGDYDDVLTDHGVGVIQEPMCGEDVSIAIKEADLGGEGADLICENNEHMNYTDPNIFISAPNSCVLLCDLHLAMTFESKLDDKGVVQFENGDDGGNPIVESTIKCW